MKNQTSGKCILVKWAPFFDIYKLNVLYVCTFAQSETPWKGPEYNIYYNGKYLGWLPNEKFFEHFKIIE